MKWLKYIVLAIGIAIGSVAYCAAPSWEQTGQYKAIDDSEGSGNVDVTVRDGYIYIHTPKTVSVKVTSIVGQLISQQTINAGDWRMKISVRGIYILKIGDTTTRVTI